MVALQFLGQHVFSGTLNPTHFTSLHYFCLDGRCTYCVCTAVVFASICLI